MRQQEQPTFASVGSVGFDWYRKPTRKEKFLQEMEAVIPWEELVEEIEPYYPKNQGPGRPAWPLKKMLKLYFLQIWYGLSDPKTEEEVYDSYAFQRFVGIDLGREGVPDETTICKFRHLLERHGLAQRLLERVNRYLEKQGLRWSRGTIVDATVVRAPVSTKNQKGERDPEMGSTKKGKNWEFGMKVHVGVDAKSKLVHSVVVTPANVHDSQVADQLVRGTEREVYGDRAYMGQEERIRRRAPRARSCIEKRAVRGRRLSEAQRRRNRKWAKIRCRVEHVFGVMKQVFRWGKVRFRGLYKNAQYAMMVIAAVNLYLARNWILQNRSRQRWAA